MKNCENNPEVIKIRSLDTMVKQKPALKQALGLDNFNANRFQLPVFLDLLGESGFDTQNVINLMKYKYFNELYNGLPDIVVLKQWMNMYKNWATEATHPTDKLWWFSQMFGQEGGLFAHGFGF